MRIIGTHHIALRTPNFEQMRAFYSDVLGMAYLGGFAGKNIIFLDAGTTTVELIEWEGTPEQPSQGWHHLALEVEDTDAAYAELVAQGVPFHIEPRSVPPEAPVVRLAFFTDPDGNQVELFQPIGNRYPAQ